MNGQVLHVQLSKNDVHIPCAKTPLSSCVQKTHSVPKIQDPKIPCNELLILAISKGEASEILGTWIVLNSLRTGESTSIQKESVNLDSCLVQARSLNEFIDNAEHVQ